MYRSVTGDTWDLIARKTTGDDNDAGRIQGANPGVLEPIQAGTVINIPPRLDSAATASQSVDPDEVVIAIDGQVFRYWTAVVLTRSVDAISKLSFTIPFDPDNHEARDLFRTGQFRSVAVSVGGELYFTGRMVPEPPIAGPNGSTRVINAYSLPGVLEQCSIPESVYPLEFKRLTLFEISQKILDPFWLDIVAPTDTGPAFGKVKASPSAKVLAFLTTLAQQRGFVISDNAAGNLVIHRSAAAGGPVASLEEGRPPVGVVSPRVNQDAFYSHITGIKPAKTGSRAVKYTQANDRLRGLLRPFTFTASDTEAAEIEDAVSAKMGRMYANAVGYQLPLPTWRTPSGELWTENTTLKLRSPSAEIYNPYEFLIRTVSLRQDSTSKTVNLGLMIPGGFAGEIPEALPWDE